MHTLRRLFALSPRDLVSRLSPRRLLALFLIIVVPGALVVPICCGIYGALRHSLGGKVGARVGVPVTIPEAPPR